MFRHIEMVVVMFRFHDSLCIQLYLGSWKKMLTVYLLHQFAFVLFLIASIELASLAATDTT